MEKIILERKPDCKIELLESIEYAFNMPHQHQEIQRGLLNRNPYTISVLIERLDYNLCRKGKYVKYSYQDRLPLYNELMFKNFFKEFGQYEGNNIYAEWLKKYKDDDNLIFKKELEARYKAKILKKHTNLEKLYKDRKSVSRERYYNLPIPLNHIDWRNPFDNIFVWHENGKKLAVRGGSGSSGQRENNSCFIYGLSLINKETPVPSYIFVYTNHNELLFGKSFKNLCVPRFDIGSNYFLDNKTKGDILSKTKTFEFNTWAESIKEIVLQ